MICMQSYTSCLHLHTGAFMVLPISPINDISFCAYQVECFTQGSYKCAYSIYYLLHLSNWSTSPEIKQECVIGNREQFSRLITAGAARGTLMHGWFAGKWMSLWCNNNKVVSTQESPVFPYRFMEGCGVVLTLICWHGSMIPGQSCTVKLL